jgi:alginate O-acetyltransferase complex protein AlgI
MSMQTSLVAPAGEESVRSTLPIRRFVLAWVVIIGVQVGFWCCRPWLATRVFDIGQIVVLMLSWKIAALICMTPRDWSRMTRLRLLAFCFWLGMQPRQFLVGQKTPRDAPLPTIRGFVLNLLTGLVLVVLVPRILPAGTPWVIRFTIGLVGFCFLMLIARFDLWALIFRAMGFAVEKLWDCPVAATSLGDFWGKRWNRIVSGFLREVVFMPLARRVGPRLATLAVFLYSGLYHEGISVMTGSGYGGPMLYFLIQYAGVMLESSRAARKVLRDHPWLGRVWTAAVLILPIRLFLSRAVVDDYVFPLLTASGIPGLDR